MSRPFHRYCYYLASKLKMSVRRLLSEMDSLEISTWMAFDMTNNEEWLKTYNTELELKMSKEMSDEQRVRAFKRLLGVRE